MLENPEFYITRVGKFLRAHSLDELPQIWDIFIGNMSVIGERDIIVTTKKNLDFSRVVTANSVSL
jgi:O-antigen biosynthesis protein WbqP